MTDVHEAQIATVWFATKPFDTAKLAPTDKIRVTAERPESGEWSALYELHPPLDVLEEISEGVYEVQWGDALGWPHQITSA